MIKNQQAEKAAAWTPDERAKVLQKALEALRADPALPILQAFNQAQQVLPPVRRVRTTLAGEKWFWFKDGVSTGMSTIEKRRKIATSQVVAQIRRSWEKKVQIPVAKPREKAVPPPPAPLEALPNLDTAGLICGVPPGGTIVAFPTLHSLEDAHYVVTTVHHAEVVPAAVALPAPVGREVIAPLNGEAGDIVVMLGLLVEALTDDRKQAQVDRDGLKALVKVIDQFDTRLSRVEATLNGIERRMTYQGIGQAPETPKPPPPQSRKPRVLVVGFDSGHQTNHIKDACKGHVEKIEFQIAQGVTVPAHAPWDYIIVTKKAPPMWKAAAHAQIPKEKIRDVQGNPENVASFIKTLPEVLVK